MRILYIGRLSRRRFFSDVQAPRKIGGKTVCVCLCVFFLHMSGHSISKIGTHVFFPTDIFSHLQSPPVGWRTEGEKFRWVDPSPPKGPGRCPDRTRSGGAGGRAAGRSPRRGCTQPLRPRDRIKSQRVGGPWEYMGHRRLINMSRGNETCLVPRNSALTPNDGCPNTIWTALCCVWCKIMLQSFEFRVGYCLFGRFFFKNIESYENACLGLSYKKNRQWDHNKCLQKSSASHPSHSAFSDRMRSYHGPGSVLSPAGEAVVCRRLLRIRIRTNTSVHLELHSLARVYIHSGSWKRYRNRNRFQLRIRRRVPVDPVDGIVKAIMTRNGAGEAVPSSRIIRFLRPTIPDPSLSVKQGTTHCQPSP